MVYSNEKEFQTGFIKRLQRIGFYIRNIPDIGNVKKPFDLSGNYQGLGFAIELKIVKTYKTPTPEGVYKMLYPHQVANLLQFKNGKSQGISFVSAYHVDSKETYLYDIEQKENSALLTEIRKGDLESKEFENIFDLIIHKKLLFLCSRELLSIPTLHYKD